MRKHLTILYGSDRKTNIVTNTVKVCADYFDRVHIINTAISEFRVELESSLQSLNLGSKLEVEDLGFYYGDTDVPRRLAISRIDVGDWFMWLDADERPTQYLLDDLDKIIVYCEANNLNCCRSPVMDHLSSGNHNNGNFFLNRFQDREYTYVEMQSVNPQSRSEWMNTGTGVPFLMSRFYKKNEGIYIESSFGGHTWIHNKMNDGWIYNPNYMNHYKSSLQSHVSCVLHTYFNMQSNCSVLEQANELLTSEEWIKLREFQSKTKVITADDLVRKLYVEKDVGFKQELKMLLDSDVYKNSKIGPGDYKHFYEWAHTYDLSLDIPEEHLVCGRECCKYEKIQL